MADVFSKLNKAQLSFPQNNLQHRLPMIKCELLSKIQIFGKIVICKLKRSPIHKDFFSDKINGDTNEYNFKILYIEMCQHLEDLNQYFPNNR